MDLKQLGFTNTVRRPSTKNKERIEKFMQTGNTYFIYRSELDKVCFQHSMALGKSKDLAKRTQSGKVLRDKAFKIASDPKYDGYQRELASIVYKFFDKRKVFVDLNQIINLQMNFESRSLENSREERFIHLSETIFGVLI